ncbi:FtsW/RodA/SpoVE family cell cycle protein [Metabacillus iocasae]|uniref:Cell division protein FtsW (Lipid II flippase) n=1 Tax=Priestia iocasae TaxID=2291674 RepID=A0ABS2QTC8_9BACI|nr:FtsW/RodA/SpoVE family cell cycle protein [Metabacillus iocasae]MBM7702729.1 cell division protein FtsW (lipid II flippase) [Metabacillus iocasae]
MRTKKEFLEKVTTYIRSKEAKDFVSIELKHHIDQSRQQWIEKGLTEVQAEQKAIEQMGDPEKLGIKMNKLHRPKIDWMLLLLFTGALGLGFLPLLIPEYTGVEGLVDSRIVSIGLAIIVAIGLMLIDYRKLSKSGWLAYIAGCLVLILPLIFPSFGIMSNGKIYIALGNLILTAFIALPFFLVAWARFFEKASMPLYLLGGLFILPGFLFLQVPDLATFGIYTGMVGFMFLFSSYSRKSKVYTISLAALTLVGYIGFILIGISKSSIKPYQLERLLGFINPSKYSDTSGYMYVVAKKYLSEAGWVGQPISSEGLQLPSAHTEFVFVTLTYAFGWIFALFLFLFLLLFIIRMVMMMMQVQDSFGKLLLIGGITLYGIPFMINILMSLGFFPIIGVSLPFMSHGNTGILVNTAIIGLALSVYRRKNLIRHATT